MCALALCHRSDADYSESSVATGLLTTVNDKSHYYDFKGFLSLPHSVLRRGYDCAEVVANVTGILITVNVEWLKSPFYP